MNDYQERSRDHDFRRKGSQGSSSGQGYRRNNSSSSVSCVTDYIDDEEEDQAPTTPPSARQEGTPKKSKKGSKKASKKKQESPPAVDSSAVVPSIPLPEKSDPELLKVDQNEVMAKLQAAMDRTTDTQKLLQEWDRANGLPKSHSQTMVNSSRSRKQLTDGVILKKWNGTPLLNFAKEGQEAAAGRLSKNTLH